MGRVKYDSVDREIRLTVQKGMQDYRQRKTEDTVSERCVGRGIAFYGLSVLGSVRGLFLGLLI